MSFVRELQHGKGVYLVGRGGMCMRIYLEAALSIKQGHVRNLHDRGNENDVI